MHCGFRLIPPDSRLPSSAERIRSKATAASSPCAYVASVCRPPPYPLAADEIQTVATCGRGPSTDVTVRAHSLRCAISSPIWRSGTERLLRHTSQFILSSMATVRRTISLPPAVAARLDREAERRKTSFSSLVTELVSQQPEPLPYAGVVDDDEDLSQRVEEVLARLAG